MAFPNQSKPMPPPSKRGSLNVAIVATKPKGMPPPKQPSAQDPGEAMEGGDKKGSLEKAGVIRADDHCQACENWAPETGDCSKLPGTFAPDDACLAYFEPIGQDEDEPDADDQGEEAPDDAMAPQV